MTYPRQILAALVFAVGLPAQALASDVYLGEGGSGATRRASDTDSRAADDDGPPLLFGKSLEIGGYGSVDVAYSRMFGEDGALVGLQGALLLDHRLSLGIAGYGWTTRRKRRPMPSATPNASRRVMAAPPSATRCTWTTCPSI